MERGEIEYRVSRKVHRNGTSLVVTIPKVWCEAKGVADGDKVTVAFNGILRILTDADLPPKATK